MTLEFVPEANHLQQNVMVTVEKIRRCTRKVPSDARAMSHKKERGNNKYQRTVNGNILLSTRYFVV
jgi:hypothetical protein